MRTVLLNPHVDDFLSEPLHFKAVGRRALKKYGFLLEGILREKGECWLYNDYRVSAVIPSKLFLRLPRFLRKKISSLELQLWVLCSDLSGKVKILTADDIQCDDILLAFSYKSARGWSIEPDPFLFRFKVVIYHLSHYFTYTSEKACYLQKIPNLWLSGDSDIKENPYFKLFFSWYRREILFMPFAVSPRFQNHSLARESRCLATGTFHDLSKEVPRDAYQDYISFTGLTTYHPIRAELFKLKDTQPLSTLIECMVQTYRSYDNAGRFKQLIRHLSVRQKKYFSIDIVEAYNRYRLAVVGEESTGFPALGSFESMACGAVLVAHPPAYRGYGLVPNYHYLAYDGTVNGLISALEEASSVDLSRIAAAGQAFVNQELSADSVYRKWMSAIRLASTGSTLSSAIEA
jgi:hypothetical protein